MPSKVMTLNCPNCGALVSRETMKCEYCGADLIITADGSLASRGMMSCPKCGFSIPKGSWLCINCGEVVTEDEIAVKELQRKLRHEQYIQRKSLPSTIRDTLERNEYIHSSLIQEEFWSIKPDRIYVVTDKKLIKMEKGEYMEIPWKNIVSVGKIEHKMAFFSSYYEFTVHTLRGAVKFRYYMRSQYDTLALTDLGRFHNDVTNVLGNYNLRKRDLNAQICFYPLGQEFKFEKEEENRKELLVKYSVKYPHNPGGVLEFHISKKMKEGKTRWQAIEELIKET